MDLKRFFRSIPWLWQLLLRLSSLKLTVVCLAKLLVLVFVMTIAQVNMGIFMAKEHFFEGFFVFWTLPNGFGVPVFLSGYVISAVLSVNLLAAFVTRFTFGIKKLGLWVSHLGLMVLMVGGGLTAYMAVESQMVIEEGQTRYYTQSRDLVEMVVIRSETKDLDHVVSIPQKRLSKKKVITHQELPFDVVIKDYFANSSLTMKPSALTSVVNRGVGAQMSVEPLPLSTNDQQPNVVSAFVELRKGGEALGTWLLSSGLGAPQSIQVEGVDYYLFIRPKRYYNAYSVTLKDFSHDVYPGTEIPKNFSSLVHVEDPEFQDSRDVLIYMNHPLRYRGKTYFQASFGKGDTLSVLQVVDNPAWLFPYIASTMMGLGLLFHFLVQFGQFRRRRQS